MEEILSEKRGASNTVFDNCNRNVMNYPCGSVPKTALMEQGHKWVGNIIGKRSCFKLSSFFSVIGSVEVSYFKIENVFDC